MLKFLCIGAQKSATTWLFENLVRHPEVSFPGGKEVHFWNARLERDGLSWYQSLFSEAPEQCEGDITPAYSILPQARIAQVREHFPNVKLIFMVRNPIDRAWSSARMALKRAEMTFAEASEQWFVDHFNSRGSLARGDYATILTNWQQFFPERAFLTIDFTEVITHPRQVLARCYQHLALQDKTLFFEDALQTPSFQGEAHGMSTRLQQHLLQLYRPRIDAYSQLVGKDYSHWYKDLAHANS